jgi:hypothetical protein
MMTQTPRVAFSQNLGEMLNLLQYRIDSVLINEDGQPEAVLINSRLFNCICRLQNRFDVLCQRGASGFESVREVVGLAESMLRSRLIRTVIRITEK